jgi:hypothetical protein
MQKNVTPSTCGRASHPPALARGINFRRPHFLSRMGAALLLTAALFFTAAPVALAATGEDIVATAEQYLGYPYGYQCAGPNAFDCGGFVWYIYDQSGVEFKLRSNSLDLAMANTAIFEVDELAPGDILFFGSSPFSISHWGIYAGDGQVIHAYNEGTGVVYTSLGEVWPRFCYGCRLDTLEGASDAVSGDFITIGSMELPWQSSEALGSNLTCDCGEETITTTEVLQTLLRTCELLTGLPSSQLLAAADVSEADLAELWATQPLALAGRALSMAQSLSPDLTREQAVQLLLASLLVKPESGDIWYVEAIVITTPPEPYISDAKTSSQPLLDGAQIAATVKTPYMMSGAETLPCQRKQASLALQLTYQLLHDLPLTDAILSE